MWRHAKDRTVEVRKRPRPGKKPENVCNPRDLERLKPPAHVMPDQPTVLAVAKTTKNANGVQRLDDALERIATILSAKITGTVGTISPTQKLWLSIDEARALTGFTLCDLREVVASGKLNARRSGRRLRIQRASLEAFEG
jgi:excisionase family DNA binding protein